jgi:hypothetical protein
MGIHEIMEYTGMAKPNIRNACQRRGIKVYAELKSGPVYKTKDILAKLEPKSEDE